MLASMSGSSGPVGADASCGGNTGIGNATLTISPGSKDERPLPLRIPGRIGVLLPGVEFATLLLTVDPIGLTIASIWLIPGMFGTVIGKLINGIVPPKPPSPPIPLKSMLA